MKTNTYKLGQLLTIKNGKDYKHLNAGNIPVFGSGGYMCMVDKFLYDQPSILLPRKGTLSNIQYYDKPFWTVDTCFYSIVNTDLADAYYLFWYLKQLDLSGLDTGASIPSMTIKTYNSIKISLPSLPLQRRIASILSAYDNLIEANSRRIKILEQMAENLYKEWFVRFRFPNYQNTPIENGIPKGWKVERLKNITKRLPFNRLYKAADLEPIGNVIVIDQSTNAYLGYHNNEPSHYANIDNPIIIFGDHSCKFQLMIQNFSLGENVVPFISNDSGILDCYYFYFATHKLIETEEYKRHWGRLMAMKILLPSIESQKAFAKIIKPIFSQINTLQLQSANLIRQRDLLLPRLMSGQLTPLTNQ